MIYWEVCVKETGEAEVIQENIQFAAILNIKEAVLLIGEGFKCPVALLGQSHTTQDNVEKSGIVNVCVIRKKKRTSFSYVTENGKIKGFRRRDGGPDTRT